ncbi:hypothetical protein K445DRAFT_284360 [Daldinia sp. EC12]|nr:hypothetical protein K445DRAFT_284360 [Daldinia sp. EC12]
MRTIPSITKAQYYSVKTKKKRGGITYICQQDMHFRGVIASIMVFIYCAHMPTFIYVQASQQDKRHPRVLLQVWPMKFASLSYAATLFPKRFNNRIQSYPLRTPKKCSPPSYEQRKSKMTYTNGREPSNIPHSLHTREPCRLPIHLKNSKKIR